MNNFTDMIDKSATDQVVALTASASCIVRMLVKLLNRKEKGKSPFPSEFGFESKKEVLLNFDKMLIADEKKLGDIKEEMIKASQVAKEATSYIKMKSLKNDFVWISDGLQDISNLL